MNCALRQRTLRRLDDIASRSLSRRLTSPSGYDLSSNDYLGLASDERVTKAAINSIACGGYVGSTGSRLLRGHRQAFVDAERAFAAWKGTESSLFFGSGYQANLGVLQTFVENGDVVFSDRLNHASLIDGIRLTKARRVVFEHCDVDDLARQLMSWEVTGQKFLVTESLFSMEGTIAPLAKYVELCRDTNTVLIVDEAHAVGVYGREGSGLIEEFGVGDSVFLSVNTGGKALGVGGAFVAGEAWAIEYLIQKARSFIFSTAPSPMVPVALTAAISIVRSDVELRSRLHRTTRIFRRMLEDRGLLRSACFLEDRSPVVSIHIGDNSKALRVAHSLQSLGFDVRAIRPPTVPEGTARLRVSINVSLSEEMILAFAENLQRIMGDEETE